MAFAAILLPGGAARGVGEAVNGFPNWAERVIHEWINRARVDPQVEMTACGSSCGEAACYSQMPPLSWNLALNRAARFHSAAMQLQSFFSHTSACTLVSNIGSLYPGSCNGAASCACVGGTKTCSPTCTPFNDRIQLFGGTPYGEIIASPSEPNTAFYLWLYEPAGTSCSFSSQNGHRWLILKAAGNVGAGVSGPSVGDFGGSSAPAKIPSGVHYPQQAATVNAWANWYDSAAPQSAAINVGGQCFAMNLTRGTGQNGAYTAALAGFGSGCHRYYFSFVDSSGTTVTYPTTGSLAIGTGAACPDWDSSRPADCGAGGPTHTPTLSPTSTPTRTPTPTWTSSRTPTVTPSRTATNSRTPTDTPTSTRTASSSPTSTATPTAETAAVMGYVRRFPGSDPFEGLTIRLIGPTGAVDVLTDAAGSFDFRPTFGDWELRPHHHGDGGPAEIDTADAAAALDAVVGMAPSPPEIALAGDVSGNGTLSAYDAALILKRARGDVQLFPAAAACGTEWIFLPTAAAAPNQDLEHPSVGPGPCIPGAIHFLPLSGSVSGRDFIAIRFGDLSAEGASTP